MSDRDALGRFRGMRDNPLFIKRTAELADFLALQERRKRVLDAAIQSIWGKRTLRVWAGAHVAKCAECRRVIRDLFQGMWREDRMC